MLVWKTQTLDVNVASLRYRCLFPLRYLSGKGISSVICGGADPVQLTENTQAIIFVKSFRAEDVQTCEQAYQLGVPIILDLCDNIFIEGYGVDSHYDPAKNFRLMARRAAAIVTTGAAMKAQVERSLAETHPAIAPNPDVTVVVIPDGNESLSDIKYAFRALRWKRVVSLVQRRIVKRVVARALRLAQKQRSIALKLTKQHILKSSKRAYKQRKRQIKCWVCELKRTVGTQLRSYGLIRQKPPQQISQQVAIAQPLSTPHLAAPQSVSQPQRACIPKPKSIAQPTPFYPHPWPSALNVKTVLWFGNHGAKYGNFGMLNILDVATALETLSQEQPLRLMVVSNSRQKYEHHIAPLPFATDYLPWHPRKIYDYLRASDVVIVPNSQSVYSICKSANRAVLALSQGTPVIASHTPALEIFSECIWLDDWAGGLRAYLQNPDLAKAHVAQAQQVIAQNLSGEVISEQWLSLLDNIKEMA